jgi:hypothetical protein
MMRSRGGNEPLRFFFSLLRRGKEKVYSRENTAGGYKHGGRRTGISAAAADIQGVVFGGEAADEGAAELFL